MHLLSHGLVRERLCNVGRLGLRERRCRGRRQSARRHLSGGGGLRNPRLVGLRLRSVGGGRALPRFWVLGCEGVGQRRRAEVIQGQDRYRTNNDEQRRKEPVILVGQ